MFGRAANLITEDLIKRGVVVAEDREIYQFGAQQSLSILLNILTFAGVGLLIGVFWPVAIFTCAYISLRVYAGGYHASTPFRCYVIATKLVIVAALMMRFVYLPAYITLIALLIYGLFIVFTAPIDNRNKRLDLDEKRVYRVKTIVISLVQISLVCICLYFGVTIIVTGIFWAMTSVVILMMLGIILNLRQV